MRLYQLDAQTSGTYNWETYNWDSTVQPNMGRFRRLKGMKVVFVCSMRWRLSVMPIIHRKLRNLTLYDDLLYLNAEELTPSLTQYRDQFRTYPSPKSLNLKALKKMGGSILDKEIFTRVLQSWNLEFITNIVGLQMTNWKQSVSLCGHRRQTNHFTQTEITRVGEISKQAWAGGSCPP